MNVKRPDLLASAAMRKAVVLPPHIAGKLDGVPGATWEIDDTGDKAELVLDLTNVPRRLRRRALKEFRRVGGKPEPRRKPPSKRKMQADAKEETLAMEIKGHAWTRGHGSRVIESRRHGNTLWVVGRVTCGKCTAVGELKSRNVWPAEQMDKRLKQKGWRLDPPLCPDCVKQPKEERMATEDTTAVPSNKAAMAQAKVFKMLGVHFDVEKGRYLNGYSDKRLSDETGVAVAAIAVLRSECFGELKEDPAVAELRSDIAALEALCAEQVASLQQTVASEIASIKAKLARVSK